MRLLSLSTMLVLGGCQGVSVVSSSGHDASTSPDAAVEPDGPTLDASTPDASRPDASTLAPDASVPLLPEGEATLPRPTGRFVKVGPSGEGLDDDAALSPTGPWTCTWDSLSALAWEMKTTDGSLHDARATFSWYEPQTMSRIIGWQGNPGCAGVVRCETSALREATNTQRLCGGADWRLPTRLELEGLVRCATGRDTAPDAWVRGVPCADYATNTTPRIDPLRFPNVDTSVANSGGYFFWTDESYDVLPEYAFYVNFRNGSTNRTFKSEHRGVRLVRPAPRPAASHQLRFEGEPTLVARRALGEHLTVRSNVTSTGRLRWEVRLGSDPRWSELSCEAGVDFARCPFEVAWAPGTAWLRAQARLVGGALAVSNELELIVTP